MVQESLTKTTNYIVTSGFRIWAPYDYILKLGGQRFESQVSLKLVRETF